MSIDDRKIFITGASSGIGREITITMSKTANLWITGRDIEKLAETKSLCNFNNAISTYDLDLTRFDKIGAMVDTLPLLDGVVLNAGIIDYIPARLISVKRIRDTFSINFDSNVLLVQELLKKKKIKNGASIVFISSISSLVGVVGTSLYAASKAALTAFARVLASELASKRIRVNVISPGIINTDRIENNDQLSSNITAHLVAKYPLGLGTPADVANQVSYLLSDNSRWVTGTNVILDGGYSLS